MNYWLMKSEPDVFSIDDLARKQISPWDGVRNYQARNYMRDSMRIGDGVLFYHSSCAEPGVVGIARIASAARPDPSQFDPRSEYHDAKATPEQPRWCLVDVAFVRKLRGVIRLERIKQEPALARMPLVQRGSRLSITPVTAAEWNYLLSLEPSP